MMMDKYQLNSKLKNSICKLVFYFIFRIDSTKAMKTFVLNKNILSHTDKHHA
jgi:hypothetical protein